MLCCAVLCNTLIVSTTYCMRPFLLLLSLSLSLSIFRFLFSGARTTLSGKKKDTHCGQSHRSLRCRLSRYRFSRARAHTHTHTSVTYAHVLFYSHRLQPAHSGPLTTPCGSPSQQFDFLVSVAAVLLLLGLAAIYRVPPGSAFFFLFFRTSSRSE